MAETEERHGEQIDEAQREMSATADEMTERGERVDRSIDEAKSTHARALDDDSVPTASSDWEEGEPDEDESSGGAGFDDPEDVDLDDDDDDLEDDDGHADDEDEDE